MLYRSQYPHFIDSILFLFITEVLQDYHLQGVVLSILLSPYLKYFAICPISKIVKEIELFYRGLCSLFILIYALGHGWYSVRWHCLRLFAGVDHLVWWWSHRGVSVLFHILLVHYLPYFWRYWWSWNTGNWLIINVPQTGMSFLFNWLLGVVLHQWWLLQLLGIHLVMLSIVDIWNHCFIYSDI